MSILADITSLLLPRHCPVCRRRLGPAEPGLCPLCAMSLPRVQAAGLDDNAMLRRLWTRVPVEHAFALLAYRHSSPFHGLLVRIKYEGDTSLALGLGEWVGHEALLAGLSAHADVLVPVPLTRRRMRERGYNQARLLAEGAAAVLHVPVEDMLVRQQQSSSQTTLSAEQRGFNASGLYEARVPQPYRGGHIVLVDDVMTTGSTLAQCAEAILAADPTAHVSLLTLAFSGA